MKKVRFDEIPTEELRDRLLNDPESVIPYKRRSRKHGTQSEYKNHGCRCAPCRAAHNRQTRAINRKRKGVEYFTEEDCIALLKAQGGKCAICEKELKWPDKFTHVDHDHVTSKVRGIICFKCNTALGFLNDDPALVRKAAAYLERSNQ